MPFMGQNLLIQYYGTILQGFFKLMESYMYLPISVFLPFLSSNLLVRFFFRNQEIKNVLFFSSYSDSPSVHQSRSPAVPQFRNPELPLQSRSLQVLQSNNNEKKGSGILQNVSYYYNFETISSKVKTSTGLICVYMYYESSIYLQNMPRGR